MIWDKEHETMPRVELEKLQIRRLQAKLRDVYDKVPFYRRVLQEKGIGPDSVRSLKDLTSLPFTVKSDFRDNYPYGLLAAPRDEVVRLHASSGTTGKPIVVAYTRNVVALWAEVMARTLTAGGMTYRDVVQNSYGYGLFTGGLGIHYGAERLGAVVIPASVGNTKRQIMLMQDLGTTVLTATPSYALIIAETAEEMGVDPRTLGLRIGFFGAEPWSERMRQEIEANLGLAAIDIYGLSEIIGPGVSAECEHKCGMHIFEDHFLAEIIDPETCAVLPDGSEGELVLTTLSKWAMPMIRYRTRDITTLDGEPCGCGRTLRRIRRIGRRSDDMFIIRGVNVFPSQVEAALLKVEGTLPHYQIVLTRDKGLDNMEVQVEVTPEVFSDKVGALEEVRRKLGHAIEQVLGIRVHLSLIQPHTIQRSEGKAKRVIDQRKM